MDLLDFFRGKHSWAKLDRLLGRLPADPSRSQLVAEQMDDDELAERELELQEERRKQGIPEPPSRPPVQVWSTEVSYLAASLDRLAEMIATLIAASGGKPPRVTPVPRPQTAVDRATARRSRQRHNALVAEVEAARNRESKV